MTTPSNKTKRDRPTDNTPPARSKKNKDNQAQVCPICEKNIIEADDSVEGEDAVFCEGQCKFWLHRKCVGLTKKAYIEIGNSEDPYVCPHCAIDCYRKEINELKELVKSLSEKLSSSAITTLGSPETVQPPSTVNANAAIINENPNTTQPIVKKSNNTKLMVNQSLTTFT